MRKAIIYGLLGLSIALSGCSGSTTPPQGKTKIEKSRTKGNVTMKRVSKKDASNADLSEYAKGDESASKFAKGNDTRNIGSCKKLEGNICVIKLFIEISGTRWTTDEIMAYNNRIQKAENWIVSQANKYNKQLKFTNVQLYQDNPYKLPKMPTDEEWEYTMVDILKNSGYDHPKDLVAKCKQQGFDGCLLLMINSGAGRSWCMNVCQSYYNELQATAPLEFCNLHRLDDCDNQMERTGTIAHEILHTFGAWDMYDVSDQRNSRLAQAFEQNFPNSIMRDSYMDLNQLEIDWVNEYILGLTDKFDPEMLQWEQSRDNGTETMGYDDGYQEQDDYSYYSEDEYYDYDYNDWGEGYDEDSYYDDYDDGYGNGGSCNGGGRGGYNDGYDDYGDGYDDYGDGYDDYGGYDDGYDDYNGGGSCNGGGRNSYNNYNYNGGNCNGGGRNGGSCNGGRY